MDWKEYIIFLCITIMAILIFRIIDGIVDRKTWQEKAWKATKEQADLLEKQIALLSKHFEQIAVFAELIIDMTEENANTLNDINLRLNTLDSDSIAELNAKIDQELSRLGKTQEKIRAILQETKAKQDRLREFNFDKIADEFWGENESA